MILAPFTESATSDRDSFSRFFIAATARDSLSFLTVASAALQQLKNPASSTRCLTVQRLREAFCLKTFERTMSVITLVE